MSDINYAPAFKVYDDSAKTIFGDGPKLELLYENYEYPFAHEAGVFMPEDNTLFITSNQYNDCEGGRKIQVCKVSLPSAGGSTACEEIDCPDIPMANGGVNYENGLLFCAQGTLDTPGGIVFMEPKPPYRCRKLISGFHGREFNSVNDVVVHSDGSIWFTDPIYGFEQGIRPKPKLPNQAYRYDPERGSVRAVADGFGRPNGICFSPDEKIVYITDTDWIHGDGTTDDCRVSHILLLESTVSY
ncbi:hypothetical protein FALCPG4_008627 [Fusarium falciforme]